MRAFKLLEKQKRFLDKYYLICILILAFFSISFVSLKILHNFPNSADEYAYVFQAKNLARLQTHHHLHPSNDLGENLQNYFYLVHIGHTDGKYYGRFPFGYSIFLVPFVWLEDLTNINAYWLTNTLFGVLTIYLLYIFGKRFFNNRVGIVASVAGITSAWFLLTSGSYFSHASNAFFVGLFLFLFCVALDKKEKSDTLYGRWIMFSGFAFGLAIVTRFLDPLPYLILLIILYLGWVKKLDKSIFTDVFKFAAGGVFWLAFLLLYNYDLTGNPLTTPYEYYNPNDQGTRFIFQVPQKDGSILTDYDRIYNIGYVSRTLPNVKLLFHWHFWAWLFFLSPLVFALKRYTLSSRWILLSFIIAPLLVISVYMIYGGPPANQYGPRYYYSFFIPLTLISAAVLDTLVRRDRYLLIIAGGFALFSVNQIVRHATVYEEKVYERTNLFRTIKEMEIENAVVFLKTRSGSIHQVDLPRNSLDFDNSVLIAQDNNRYGGHSHYGPLIRAYPDKKYYEYYYRGKDRLGELKPLWTQVDGSWDYSQPLYSPRDVIYSAKGLVGQYFSGKNFDKLMYQRLDQEINFKWGRGSPFENIADNHFSVRWVGLFNAKEKGEYRFTSTSDDGVKIQINNELLINNWRPHALLTESNSIFLDIGQHYLIIEYFDEIMDAELRVEIETPSGNNQLLNSDFLTPIISTN